MKNTLKINNLLDLNHTIARDLFINIEYPWEALPKISEFISTLGNSLPESEYTKVCENVWVAKNTNIAKSASISGPAIIGKNSEIRHCAFIRGNCIIGDNCVVGNSTELKNVILFNNVQVPHYNYVGDSILGYKAHMGAGSITSNVKSDKSLIVLKLPDEQINTYLKKFGAIIGDYVEIGCNTVLNPGTIVGRNTNIYPLSNVRGVIGQNKIYKSSDSIVEKY